jgi:hypothetical protein
MELENDIKLRLLLPLTQWENICWVAWGISVLELRAPGQFLSLTHNSLKQISNVLLYPQTNPTVSCGGKSGGDLRSNRCEDMAAGGRLSCRKHFAGPGRSRTVVPAKPTPALASARPVPTSGIRSWRWNSKLQPRRLVSPKFSLIVGR